MGSDSIHWDPGEKPPAETIAHSSPPQRTPSDPEKALQDHPEDAGDGSEYPPHEQSKTPRSTTRKPPPISFDPWTKKNSIILAVLGLLFFDLVLPCLVYYLLYTQTNLDEQDVLGIACASLGIGELVELPLRGWWLVRHHEEYGPLGQRSRWAGDFFFWWYVAATVIGVVPYIAATDLDDPIEWLFLMAPGLIVGFAVVTAVVSAVPFRLPFRVSSDARGVRCKPFAYYVVEDFVAVDAHQKRLFRRELQARYNGSQVFRRMMWEVNMWWAIGGMVFIGGLSGITWGMIFPVAYGLSFGLLFVWIGIWSLGTWLWVKRALRIERAWFLQSTTSAECGTGQDGILV